jgi:hypothetical protein
MKVSLNSEPEEFKRQVAALRSDLHKRSAGQGQEAVSARMMIPVLPSYLAVMRAELRDEVMPDHVMTGAADMIANLALTTVQSMVDAPPLVEGQAVEQLLMRACEIACQSIAQGAAAQKPRLSIVKDEDTVIHMKPRGK